MVGAGVVVPGLVDREAGVATYSANIGWRDLELVRSLGAEWRLPVRIANDVASGGVAEHRLGAGVGTADLVFVLHRHRDRRFDRLRGAPRDRAPRRDGGDRTPGCPERHPVRVRTGRMLEAVASAAAIARRYTELSGHGVTGAHEVVARRATDAVARQVWQEAVEALADALGVVSLLVGPALVVIGGGLSRAGEALVDPLRLALRERTPVVQPGRGDRLGARRPGWRDRRRPAGSRRWARES